MSEKSVFDQYLDGCAPLTEIAKAAARGNARRDEAMTPTEPVAEAGGVLDALKLAEDVLSARSVFDPVVAERNAPKRRD